MPYIKSISLHNTVDRSLAYILNPEKTEGLLYTTALNCMANAEDAYLNMKMVYEHFSRKKYNEPPPLNGKGRVKAIHYIQSFDPQDNISPEEAHRISKAFARKTFGDDCQIVIATHCDKNHIHSHFILNSYSLTGKKFYDNQTTLNRIKEYSDRVCLAFGIQPYDKSKGKGKTMAYNEWEHKQHGTSWKQKIRVEIDRLIASVKNIDELLYELGLLGYTIKRGKYISIKAEGQQRFVRCKTLGEDYTEASLISRIRWRDVGANVTLSGEPAPIRDDYISTINDVSQLAKDGRKIQRKRDNTAPYSSQNDMDVYKLSAQLTIINRDNIHSIGELEGKIESLKDTYEKARQELNTLLSEQDRLNSLVGSADTFYELSEKSSLSISDKIRLNICRQTMQKNAICSREDFEHLKQLQSDTKQKISALNNNFESCKKLYGVYADIAKTYHEILKGDYISRLVEEKKRQEQNTVKKKSR